MKSSHMWSLVPNGWSSVFVLAFAYENQRHSVWSCWHTYIKLKKDSQIKKLTSVFYASVLLFIINFVIRLSKYLWICEAITNTSANETIFISPCKRPWRRHKHKHKDQNFSFFLCLCSCLRFVATSEGEIPLRHNTSTRIFTTRGYVCPMKALDPDHLALKQFYKTQMFRWACACVCAEFRFHLGHPCCLCFCLLLCLRGL